MMFSEDVETSKRFPNPLQNQKSKNRYKIIEDDFPFKFLPSKIHVKQASLAKTALLVLITMVISLVSVSLATREEIASKVSQLSFV